MTNQVSSKMEAGLLRFQQAQLWALCALGAGCVLWPQQICREHYNLTMLWFMSLAALTLIAAANRKATILWWTIVVYSISWDAMFLQMSYTKKTIPLHIYLDLPTHLTFTLPFLLMLHLKSVPLFLLLVCNTGTTATFYYCVVQHSLLLAVLRAVAVQAVCLCAYVAIRRSIMGMRHSFHATGGKVGIQNKAEAQQPQGDHEQQQQQQQQQQQEQRLAKQRLQAEHGAQQQLETCVPKKHCVPKRHSHASSHGVTHSSAGAPVAAAGAGIRTVIVEGGLGTDTAAEDGGIGTKGKVAITSACHDPPGPLLPSTSRSQGVAGVSMKGCVPLVAEEEQLAKSQGGRTRFSGSSLSGRLPGPPGPLKISGFSHPGVQHLLAARAKARSGQQGYASVLELRKAGSKTAECVQLACRFAIKVNGPCQPEAVPEGALAELQQKLQRYQRLVPAASLAVRAGCLVISYGAYPCNEGLSLQEMRDETVAVALAWAQKHGLLSTEDGQLTVQACNLSRSTSSFAGSDRSSSGGSSSASQGPPMPFEYSMALHAPFLVISPLAPAPKASIRDQPQQQPQQQQQQQQQMDEALTESPPAFASAQGAICEFDLSLNAPPHFELRGWRGAADAPEELPDDVKSHSLCFLASLDGQFLGTSVEQHSQDEGRTQVQVRVSLPETMLDTAAPRLKVLVLELWAAGALVCSHSAVLLPSVYAGALSELQHWVSPVDSMPHDTKAGFWDHAVPHDKEASWEAFMSDLVHWLHFRALVASGQVQDGEGLSEQEQAVVTFGQQVQEGQEPLEQQLVLMAGVGRDLLEHSLDRSMAEVAGLVVDGLAAPPFCIPIGALFSKELSTTPDLQEMPEVPSAPVAYPAPPAPTMYDQQLPMCDQQQQAPVPASLWAASARACLRGFDTATAVAHSANATQQQQQQQQDGPPLPVPTETGYQEWGTSFTKNLLAMRFTCCCLGTLIAVGRVVLLPENSCIDKALALGLLLPFTLYHRPKVSLKVTRVFYQILWTFMGLGLYTPMDSNTRIMICLNVEVLVFLFLSSFLEQVRLHELLRERLIFSAVFVVLYQGLQTPHALLRSLLVNLITFVFEAAADIYLRYLYLKYARGQHEQQQQKQQQLLPHASMKKDA